ncbi:MAG: hypothetical protein GW941_02640 [Candidatus Pacebacteria bacterium]|nr:hypothetical protein [Candidatus Paceibacterota bacterium]
MKKKFSFLLLWLRDNLPLFGVVFIGLAIAYLNIDLNKSYSGWDNIIAELDVVRYARQVFFGAWTEHQSFGAPAAQGQLAEVTRLPILFLLKWLLPDNLVRYTYIFSTFIIGGVGMYFYISKIWLKGVSKMSNWLGFLGGVYYLLHILTLQQFYISFEMFMAQFAFFPFLLILLHNFVPKSKQSAIKSVFTVKNILLFIGLQFLISPSAHTQTVFYLGVLFSLVYMVVISRHQGLIRSLILGFLIGLMTFMTNVYWIMPNLYYGLHNAHYVSESRDNYLFGPESVGSIKDASTFSNLTSGTQYLFNWKDYSFSEDKFHFIFNEWQDHLGQLGVSIILQLFGLMTLLGLFTTILDKDVGPERFAISYVYIFCLALIWLDLFPTGPLLDLLYQNDSFLEAFRNPFTKLSIIYSVVSVLLFTHLVSLFVDYLSRRRKKIIPIHFRAFGLIIVITMGIIYTAWPTFRGNFISEKLQLEYPDQYYQMFNYLKTRDRDLRVLQLPQLSHAGWEYYDWQFLGKDNGYQGMGFYFFGFPQAFVNRDSDRWVETSDFFYHELKYVLDKKDPEQFASVLDKYNVDLIIVDETKIDSSMKHDYQLDHQLSVDAGLSEVWQKDFLTIYEREDVSSEDSLINPSRITMVSAETDRVRQDFVYQNEGDYILVDKQTAGIVYPFSSLTKHQLDNIAFTEEKIIASSELDLGKYNITVPGLKDDRVKFPVTLSYKDDIVRVQFPLEQIRLGEKLVSLPKVTNFNFTVPEKYSSIIVFFNNQGIIVSQGETVQPVIDLPSGENLQLAYAHKSANLSYIAYGQIDLNQLEIKEGGVLEIDWNSLINDTVIETDEIEQISFETNLDYQELDILKNPTVNCSQPRRGTVETTVEDGQYLYFADQYGVNCNGYSFDYISTAYSYFLNLVGENIKGRGIKLFVNYSNPEIVYEDYLLTKGNFNRTIALMDLSDDPRDKFHLNWESRSFGKESKDSLSKMAIGAFSIEKAANIKLERKDSENSSKVENNLEIFSSEYYLDSVHKVNYSCQSEVCFLGIDQTFDDLWLAIKVGQWELLPHFRYNNWANLWEFSGEGTLIIFYLPELISFFSMIGVGSITLILLQFYFFPKSKKSKKQIKHKVKGRLTGKH